MSEKLLNDLECSFIEVIQNKMLKKITFISFYKKLLKNIGFIIKKYLKYPLLQTLLLTTETQSFFNSASTARILTSFFFILEKTFIIKNNWKFYHFRNAADVVFTSILSEYNNSFMHSFFMYLLSDD